MPAALNRLVGTRSSEYALEYFAATGVIGSAGTDIAMPSSIPAASTVGIKRFVFLSPELSSCLHRGAKHVVSCILPLLFRLVARLSTFCLIDSCFFSLRLLVRLYPSESRLEYHGVRPGRYALVRIRFNNIRQTFLQGVHHVWQHVVSEEGLCVAQSNT